MDYYRNTLHASLLVKACAGAKTSLRLYCAGGIPEQCLSEYLAVGSLAASGVKASGNIQSAQFKFAPFDPHGKHLLTSLNVTGVAH
jgi:hypothetical protein